MQAATRAPAALAESGGGIVLADGLMRAERLCDR